jgi:P pilus assembly chaperone PapD
MVSMKDLNLMDKSIGVLNVTINVTPVFLLMITVLVVLISDSTFQIANVQPDGMMMVLPQNVSNVHLNVKNVLEVPITVPSVKLIIEKI